MKGPTSLNTPVSSFFYGRGALRSKLYAMIGTSWRELGTALNMEEYSLRNIAGSYRDGPADCASGVIQCTEAKLGRAFDLETLGFALIAIGRSDIIQILEAEMDGRTFMSYTSSSSLSTFTPTPTSSLFAVAAEKATNPGDMSVKEFLSSTTLDFYRKSILLAMDKVVAWYDLLFHLNMLGDASMVAFVAKLKAQGRNGDPTLKVLTNLCADVPSFRTQKLSDFLKLLSSMSHEHVKTEVQALIDHLDATIKTKLQDGQQEFHTHDEMRTYLLENGGIKANEVDLFLANLMQKGADSLEILGEFSKEDLQACGLNPGQAIKLKKSFK